jgi:type IV pilus assembly protein PilP
MRALVLQSTKIIGGLILVATLLFGCNNSEKRAEEQAYVKRIKSRKIKEVEPLPEIKPYEPFTYTAFNLRSPFAPPVIQDQPKKFAADGGVHPDMNRHKEVLESFPLDSLRMVGTIEQHGKNWALVVDPNGTVYRLTKGNYLGQNHGHIDAITNDKISLTEIVPDPSGGWRERKGSMALVDNSKSAEHKGKK